MANENFYSTLAGERYGRSASDLQTTYKSDASVYIAEKTLMIAEKSTVLKEFGMKATLPSGNSRTFQFSRYDRLALPFSPLSDGVTPGNTQMSISTVVAVMDQWGSVITITDQAALSVKHGPLPKAVELMGYQAAETVDREIFNVLMAGTNVKFGGAATSRGTLASNSYMSTATAGKTQALLKSKGARSFDGTSYVGVVDPFVAQDIINDTTFVSAHQYADARKLWNAEIGTWMGIRWVVSNVIPYLHLMEAAGGSRIAATPTVATPAGGSFAGGETVYVTVEAVDEMTGYAVEATAPATVAGIAGSDKITVTVPATTGYKYNVYFGTTATTYLYSSLNDAGAVVELLAPASIPTSGNTPIAAPATGVSVHISFVIGQEAYAVPELLPLQTFLTPQVSSDSDPIQQRRKVGWKCDFKSVICNNDFMCRIESESAYD